jgi:hypothetical protein
MSAVLLLATASFAAFQFMRDGPVPVVTNAEWQPYVDAAKRYALHSMGMSYDTAEADLQRLIEQTTGELHQYVLTMGPTLKDAVVAANIKVASEVLAGDPGAWVATIRPRGRRTVLRSALSRLREAARDGPLQEQRS